MTPAFRPHGPSTSHPATVRSGHRRPFHLTRYFLSAGLVGIVVVMASLIWVYGELAERQLVEHETRANTDLTRAFANTGWSRYRGFVLASVGRTRESLAADPLQSAMRADVLEKMHNLRVAKVKIYNREGTTVFSTDPRQIGEDKRGNSGFTSALDGKVSSLITFRAKFDGFEGEVSDRNLISTYVPVSSSQGAQAEAVFEVYSDVTALIAAQRRSLVTIVAAVLCALGALYLFQFVIVMKADRLIAAHDLDRRHQEAEVRHRAYHDELTGLPNRAQFGVRLAESLTRAARHGRRGALVYLDLDGFKNVNDTLGHAAGDELLKKVSGRIGACLRAGDLLFRMGGDEFTILLGEIDAPDDAAHVARRIVESVAAAIEMQGHDVRVGASMGIALFPDDGNTADELLKRADVAMYKAKEAGRGGFTFFQANTLQE